MAIECLEHDFHESLSLFFGIIWRLSHYDRTARKICIYFRGCIWPNLFHVFHFLDDSIIYWIGEIEYFVFRIDFFSDITILLVHPYHKTLLFWHTNDSWNRYSWSIVSRYSNLAETTSVIYHNCWMILWIVYHFISIMYIFFNFIAYHWFWWLIFRFVILYLVNQFRYNLTFFENKNEILAEILQWNYYFDLNSYVSFFPLQSMYYIKYTTIIKKEVSCISCLYLRCWEIKS